MTEFVIYGQVDENKNLRLQNTPACSQGEHKSAKLCISLPNDMAQDCDFYLEFLCPHNLWISPKLTVTAGQTHTVCQYLLENCVLQEEGQVFVQLIARKQDDKTILYKTTMDNESCIWVGKSVNATAECQKVTDLFGQTQNLLQQIETDMQSLSAVAFSGNYDDVVDAPRKLGDLPNDVGYLTPTTVAPLIPTKVSDLSNDQDYVTHATLTPLLPSRVGQLTNDVGYVTQSDVAPLIPTKVSQLTNDVGFVNQTPVTSVNNKTGAVVVDKTDVGLEQVGNFKAVSTEANQSLTQDEQANARANIGAGTSNFSGSYDDLEDLPYIPYVSNTTITIKQGAVTKGSFTLNQTTSSTITLDAGGGSCQTYADDSYTVYDDVITIPYDLGQVIDLYVTADLNYYLDTGTSKQGVVSVVYANGEEIAITEEKKYHHFQFIPELYGETFALMENGVILYENIPMINEDSQEYELAISFLYNVQSGASYNHYFVG